MVKNLPATWETQVGSLGWEDPLGKGMATHASSISVWRSPWMKELEGLQSMESQRVRQRLSLSKTKEKQTKTQKQRPPHPAPSHTHSYPWATSTPTSICSLNSNHIKLQKLTAKDNLFWLSYYACCTFRMYCFSFFLQLSLPSPFFSQLTLILSQNLP